jgi:hypothetical protein
MVKRKTHCGHDRLRPANKENMMRNSIKTFVLAAAMVTGAAGLAMAQAVPIDAADEAPDTVYNPNAPLLYGQPQQPAIGRSGGNGFRTYGSYRANQMTGSFGPYAASSPWGWNVAPGRDQSDLGEY